MLHLELVLRHAMRPVVFDLVDGISVGHAVVALMEREEQRLVLVPLPLVAPEPPPESPAPDALVCPPFAVLEFADADADAELDG